jgi:hypothetical protein
MRNILLVVGAAGLVGLFTACGGDEKPPVVSDGHSGTGGKGGGTKPGDGGTSGVGGDSAGGASEAEGGAPDRPAINAPLVSIIEPAETLNPVDGALVDQTAHVVCTALRSNAFGASALDPASVKVSILDASGKLLEEKPATATTNDNEFAADFVVTTVPSGKVSFECSASDKNKIKGADRISTFVDHGPTITVVTPAPDSANPLKGGLAIKFTVDPTPLSKADASAEVDAVTFQLDGQDYSLSEKSGTYETSIALDTLPATPSGSISITASNKRSPKAAKTTKSYSILVDGDGPVVSIESPAPKDVRGGNVAVKFTVTDKISGVDPNSVNITRWPSDTPHFFDPTKGWARAGDQYTYILDTKEVEAVATAQTTINIRASDKAGNASANGQSVQFYLDNVPPKVDLDPKNIRIKTGANCSNSFDPVGASALDDLEGSTTSTVTRFAYFRAFVWEETNSAQGQHQHAYSGTDGEQVRLYVQATPDEAATPLLVKSSDGPGNACDEIGGIKDIVAPPPFSALSGLAPNGAIWSQDDAATAPTVTPAFCAVADSLAPQGLCTSHLSDMWYTTQHSDGFAEPAVFAVSPNPNDNSCTGIDIEFLSKNQKDGWVCAAARAVDFAGNVGISPPLRICVDSPDIAGHPDCAVMSTTPPTCTDGCTPPPRGGGFIIITQ